MDPLCEAAHQIEEFINGRLDIIQLVDVAKTLRAMVDPVVTGPLVIDTTGRNTVTRDGGPVVRLTTTEMDVLLAIHGYKGEPISNAALQAAVYGKNLKRSFTTIRRYVSDLRDKLAPLHCWIKSRSREGYYFVMEEK
jgi:DNA-binding response OmpR family regulator